jgi:WhiB family transcriptional regulator, redox-sensing transcriptional regulator
VVRVADVSRLPTPVAESWDWQMEGACRGMDSALFFHPERERGEARAARDARAKAVCLRCPVMQQCRTHALAVREAYGVWGAMTAQEREAVFAQSNRKLAAV